MGYQPGVPTGDDNNSLTIANTAYGIPLSYRAERNVCRQEAYPKLLSERTHLAETLPKHYRKIENQDETNRKRKEAIERGLKTGLTSGLDGPPSRRYSSVLADYSVWVTYRKPLMIQLITADFFDFTFLAVVAVAIIIAIVIVWMNKQ